MRQSLTRNRQTILTRISALVGLSLGVVFLAQAIPMLRADLFALRAAELAQTNANSPLQLRATLAAWQANPSNPRLALQAADLSWRNEVKGSTRYTQQALSLGPARAEAWLQWAWVLITRNPADRSVAAPLQAIHQLAPAIRPTQVSVAVMGLVNWTFAEKSVRDEWQRALNFSLQYQKSQLFAEAEKRGLTLALCLGFIERYDQEPRCISSMSGA